MFSCFVTSAQIALAIMPVPGVDIVVQMPGRVTVLSPGVPAILIWLAVRVLRHGRFFGKEPSEIAPHPH